MQKEFSQLEVQKQSKYLYPAALLKYGLIDKLELRVRIVNEEDYEYFPDRQKIATGLQPIQVGFKYNLFEETDCLPNTSLIATAALPKLASPNFQSDFVAPAICFSMENTLSKKLSLTYNIGAEWEPDDVHAQYLITLVPQLVITDRIKGFAELYSRFFSAENAQHALDAGLLFKIKPNLQIDISAGLGITKSSPDGFIELGMSFRFPH